MHCKLTTFLTAPKPLSSYRMNAPVQYLACGKQGILGPSDERKCSPQPGSQDHSVNKLNHPNLTPHQENDHDEAHHLDPCRRHRAQQRLLYFRRPEAEGAATEGPGTDLLHARHG